MKEFISPAIEGFVGSFVLAAAIVVAVTSGVWRVSVRLFDAFVHHKPLPVGPGRTLE